MNTAPQTETLTTERGVSEPTQGGRLYRPDVDILETDEALLLVANLPGSAAEEIDVNFEKGTLTLQAKVQPRFRDGARAIAKEYGVGNYYRAFEVNERIDSEKIAADYTNGVLRLTLPKAKEEVPRKIAVQPK